MTALGYMRVSKSDGSQSLDLQKDALAAAGVLPGHVYQDTASGKCDDRPGLEACLKALREGDKLIAWRLDRVGRSTRHLLQIVEDLNQRGVHIQFLTGLVCGDSSTPTGKLMLTMFAGFAEYERSQMIERTKAGLASARARGRFGGRKPKMTKARMRLAMASMGKPDCCVKDLAQELKIDPSTLYSYVGANGKPTEKGVKFMEGRK